MKILRDPPDSDVAYLDALNRCFGQWGGAAQLRWVFERPMHGLLANRFVVTDDAGEWIAGSAVSWRTLRIRNGGCTLVGIMTGSWTLPAARGKGCFTLMIDESVRSATDRGAGLLLAFVTHANASSRRLVAAGSALFPSRYVFSTPETPNVQDPPEYRVTTDLSDALVSGLEASEAQQSGDCTAFVYGPGEWKGQFLERPWPTSILEAPGVGRAVLETHEDTIRVQALLPRGPSNVAALLRAALAHAQSANRKLFYFVTDPADASTEAEKLQLGGVDGSVTALIASRAALGEAIGKSRVPPESAALGPGGDASIAPLFIQSGDRM